MRFGSRVVVAGGAVALLAVAVFAGYATAAPSHTGKHKHALVAGRKALGPRQGESLVLSASLAPSVPSDPAVFGVTAGSLPWSLANGHVRIGRGGLIQVTVAGLVITTTGTNPVPDLAASLYCGGASVGTTAPVAFSSQGNAHIHAALTVPAFCPAPAVLLNPATGSAASDVKTGIYIAFDGTA
jgi:hypothetical protein